MQLVVLLLLAAVVLALIGLLVAALKWLLVVAALIVALCLIAGWRPGRNRSSLR
jgi:uncharacterized membrane protein